VADGFDVVYFASVDWGHTWQRAQQLASRLAGQGRVLYVDPLGLRAPRASDLGRLGRRGKAHAPPDLTVRSPAVWIPLPASRAAAAVNGALLRRLVRRWMRRTGVTRPVAWVGTPSPSALAALEGLPWRLVAYDAHDAFEQFHGDGGGVLETEEALARRADVVFATSALLHDRARRLNPQVCRLPNAADYHHFAREIAPHEIPSEVRALPRPVVGYVGEVAGWFDTSLVHALAVRHPTWSIVLVGPVTGDARDGLTGANVHLLGRRRYSELPRYLAAFDCCLIPFRASPLTAAVSPIKLYEYLAAGKPVVSTPLPSVLPFEGDVFVAAGPRFLEAVEEAVAGGRDRSAAEARRRRARGNTWDQRVARILEALGEADTARHAGLEPARAAR
jgi:glycosyltransferase involved in cell wall biosynthesis